VIERTTYSSASEGPLHLICPDFSASRASAPVKTEVDKGPDESPLQFARPTARNWKQGRWGCLDLRGGRLREPAKFGGTGLEMSP